MSDRSHPIPASGPSQARAHDRPWRVVLVVVSAVSMLVGMLLLVPTAYYTYLGINPPAFRPGDLYLGDRSGFIIAAFFGVLAVVALVIATLSMKAARTSRLH